MEVKCMLQKVAPLVLQSSDDNDNLTLQIPHATVHSSLVAEA